MGELWSILKDIVGGLLQKRRRIRKTRVQPYQVNRNWVDIERERVNEKLDEKPN